MILASHSRKPPRVLYVLCFTSCGPVELRLGRRTRRNLTLIVIASTVMAMAISELSGYFYGIIHSINGVFLVLITGKGP